MRQSNVIFGTLLFAFIVYITIRGQLPLYLALFKGKGSSATNTQASATPTATTSSSNDIDKALAVYDKFSTMFG